jgi:hypothetical protein
MFPALLTCTMNNSMGNVYISILRTCWAWNEALPTFVLQTMEVQTFAWGFLRAPVVWGLRQPAAWSDTCQANTHWTRDDLGHLLTCPLAFPRFLTVQWTQSSFCIVGNKGAAPCMATSELAGRVGTKQLWVAWPGHGEILLALSSWPIQFTISNFIRLRHALRTRLWRSINSEQYILTLVFSYSSSLCPSVQL